MKRPLLCLLILWITGEIFLSMMGVALIPILPLEQIVESEESINTEIQGKIREIRYRTNGYIAVLEKAEAEWRGTNDSAGSVAVYLDELEDSVSGHALSPGDRVTLHGALSLFDEATNPGQFDARSYYRAQNIRFCFFPQIIQLTESPGYSLSRRIWALKQQLREALTQAAGEDAGVLLAMFLGDKSQMSTEVKGLYQSGGISHILAISGLHISLFGMAFYRILKRAGCPHAVNLILSGGVLGIYVWMTGCSSSAIRAWIMFLVYLLAKVVGRTYDMLSAMSLAGILLLMEYPLLLWQGGFQLSFLAVIGVAAVWPVWNQALGKKCPHVWKSLVFSLAVQLTILPALTWHYYGIPLYGPILNLIVIPFTGLLLGSCVLSAASAVLIPMMNLGKLLIVPAKGILFLYESICQLAEYLPGHAWITGQPNLWQVLLYYVIFVVGNLWIMRRVKVTQEEQEQGQEKEQSDSDEHRTLSYRHLLQPVLWILILVMILSHIPARDLQISILDVGQGDGIVIRCPDGSACMIDGGSSSESNIGTYRLVPFLKHQGIGTLETIFITHGDEDHFSGIAEVLTDPQLRVKSLTLSESSFQDEELQELRELAMQANVELRCLSMGDNWNWGNVSFTCLYPSDQAMAKVEQDKNNTSLVLAVDYGMFHGMFTGDLAEEGEEEILKRYSLNKLTLLKVGHHGSKYSTSEEFLEKLQPQLAVISCGKRNRYGHPHSETLERLKHQNSQVRRTDLEGAIQYQIK